MCLFFDNWLRPDLLSMWSILFIAFLMATVGTARRPRMTSHGGDAGGEDPEQPRRLPAQCDEAGTTTNSKKRRGRKSSKLISLEQKRLQKQNKKVPVEFDEGGTWKAVGEEAAHFNNAIGLIVRNLLKPYFFQWTDQSPDDVNLIWPRVTHIFDLKDIPQVRDAVDRQSKRALYEWKHDLHSHYKRMVAEYGEEVAKQRSHISCDLEIWHRYLTHMNSERFQILSKKNKENYNKKVTKPTHGARSFAAYRHQKKDAQGQIQSSIDNYQDRHMKKDKWTTEVAKARYEKMSITKQTQATQDPESRSTDESIMSQVIKSKGRHLTGIGPTLRKTVLHSITSSSEEMVPQSVVDKIMQRMDEMAATIAKHEEMWQNIDKQHRASSSSHHSSTRLANAHAAEEEEEEYENLDD